MNTQKTVRKPRCPAWLLSRQLNTGLAAIAVLPEGVSTENLIEFIDEENDYAEDPYTPELMAMINGIERARDHFCRNAPVFFREYFEPWYVDTFSAHIDSSKVVMPEAEAEGAQQGGGNGFLLVILTLALIVVVGFAVSIFAPETLLRFIHSL